MNTDDIKNINFALGNLCALYQQMHEGFTTILYNQSSQISMIQKDVSEMKEQVSNINERIKQLIKPECGYSYHSAYDGSGK